MRVLRKKFLVRTVSISFLIIFLQSVFLPNYSYALTNGPHMPEYTAYESPGASDMVNLATGDFSFSLPILEVPGPEGSFSLPLAYNAGIGLEQQASWVGLGWSMNPGAITRNIVGFPDDANGEIQNVTVQDLVGLRGWDANMVAIGSFGWNNQNGGYGALSILGIVNAGWTKDSWYGGIIGINASNNGMYVDPVQFVVGVITLITWGAAGAAAGEGVSFAQAAGKQIAIDAIMSVGTGAITSMASASNTPNSPTDGYWKYSEQKSKNVPLQILTSGAVRLKKFKIWLDQTRYEEMYGALYLGNAPTEVFSNSTSTRHARLSLTSSSGTVNETIFSFKKTAADNKGAASDISYQPGANETVPFKDVNNPTFLATDNFSVKLAGISGSISPFRLEVGSVSMPREMTMSHTRLAPVKYLENNPWSNTSAYKVPFVYQGQLSNSYFHHVGSATSVSAPNFHFGINSSSIVNPGVPNTLRHDLNDVVLKSQRIKVGVTSTSKKIPQANHIEWLSNDEIRSGITYSSKFLDFLSGGAVVSTASDRHKFRTKAPSNFSSYTSHTSSFDHLAIPIEAGAISNLAPPAAINLTISYYEDAASYSTGLVLNVVELSNVAVSSINTITNTFAVPFNSVAFGPYAGKIADIQIQLISNSTMPIGFGGLNSLGGFSITGADGTTYHFALPIYDFELSSEVREIAFPTTKRSLIKRSEPFANTWVVTAITGPDFVDRNQNGLADKDDWGYWVKFNYGLHSNAYAWRNPYAENSYRRELNGTHESFSQGKKQLIYLNSIETRSHVALFLKGSRTDGKSASSNVVVPLKLEEIALVSRENYEKMKATYGVPSFSDQLVNVCLSPQFGSARTFLNNNCAKRVIFTYVDLLCAGANSPNGKLALSRLSIKGRNDNKLVPDYKFEYGYNPPYNPNHWDAWGMYHANPNTTNADHTPSQVIGDAEGAAWSLVKIINPLGSEVSIGYERDSYSVVASGASPPQQVESTISFEYPAGSAFACPNNFPMSTLYVNHNNTLAVGDRIHIGGSTTYSFTTPDGTVSGNDDIHKDNLRIIDVTETSITVDQSFYDACHWAPANWVGYINFSSFQGFVSKYYKHKKGDGIRVGSILMKDEFNNQNKIRYKYENEDGSSSGALSQEPDYVGIPSSMPGFPNTPAIYGRVTVLNGKLSSDNDYYSKQVYEFETPSPSHYTVTKNPLVQNQQVNYVIYEETNRKIHKWYDYLTVYENKIEDRTGKIGALKSVKIFDKAGTIASSTQITYTESPSNNGFNNFQGIYSSGLLMFDMVDNLTLQFFSENNILKHLTQYDRYHKVNRSTVLQFPWVVQKIVNSKDGFTSESQNLSWDFLTGAVDQKLEKSSLGLTIKTINQPAYLHFPELRTKAEDINNRHMLTQNAATYVFRTDQAGNALGLVSASLQLWKKDWANYRYHNGTSYVESPAEAMSSSNPVWRKGASFVWKGSMGRKQADGTQAFAPSDMFSFGAGVQPGSDWLYTGEYVRFDHFGMPLESKDMKQISSATKMGYDNRTAVASASNAQYSEIAFSSAEDEIPGIGHFGGEVALRSAGGNATVVKQSAGGIAHTGDCALSLSTGYGFVYKPFSLNTNRTYRASVWANNTNGRLYYKLNGAAEVLSQTPMSQGKLGWYRVDMEIPVLATFTSLEVGVKAASGTVVFDDFRFQPADAAMTCNVYVPLDYQFAAGQASSTWVLDNDNLYTRYETSATGLITKVYAETILFPNATYGGEKLVSENKSDYRRFYINQ
jgi:hypothetical protein